MSVLSYDEYSVCMKAFGTLDENIIGLSYKQYLALIKGDERSADKYEISIEYYEEYKFTGRLN